MSPLRPSSAPVPQPQIGTLVPVSDTYYYNESPGDPQKAGLFDAGKLKKTSPDTWWYMYQVYNDAKCRHKLNTNKCTRCQSIRFVPEDTMNIMVRAEFLGRQLPSKGISSAEKELYKKAFKFRGIFQRMLINGTHRIRYHISGACKTFPQFSKLPGELRAEIVAAAINRPRLMCSHVKSARSASTKARFPQLPALYFASKEIQAEVSKHINICAPQPSGFCNYPWTYINPCYDTVFVGAEGKPGVGWDEIPLDHEAPGLQTLALYLVRMSPWLQPRLWCTNPQFNFKLEMERVADQLVCLPDLQEVLLVRPFPNWIRSFLHSTHNYKPDAPNIKKPELVVNESGFFWNTHEDVELWLERSKKFGLRSIQAGDEGDCQDEVDALVKGLVEEDDEMVINHIRFDDALLEIEPRWVPFYRSERTSKETLQHFEGLMAEVYREKYCGIKMPKFRMVYQQEGIATAICNHTPDGITRQ